MTSDPTEERHRSDEREEKANQKTMKRKKWTEEEEVTLMTAYFELVETPPPRSNTTTSITAASPIVNISRLQTRQKRFQPIADRVNAVHHICDSSTFPFAWTWRDVSTKIQNMRNQYIGVKLKILLPNSKLDKVSSPSSSSSSPKFDWELGSNHWPNFLLYKRVFGDVDLDSIIEYDNKDEGEMTEGECDLVVDGFIDKNDASAVAAMTRRMLEEGEAGVRKREREWKEKRWIEEEEEERGRWRRRIEERREVEEMKWMEKMVEMQMEHEKKMVQMHADSSQAQLQVTSIMMRLVCQFLGPVVGGGGGEAAFGGLSQQVHGLQNHHHHQQQEQPHDQGSMGADNVKSDTSSPGQYI